MGQGGHGCSGEREKGENRGEKKGRLQWVNRSPTCLLKEMKAGYWAKTPIRLRQWSSSDFEGAEPA